MKMKHSVMSQNNYQIGIQANNPFNEIMYLMTMAAKLLFNELLQLQVQIRGSILFQLRLYSCSTKPPY